MLRGYGLWAVERKSDHAMIGRGGLVHHENWPQVEVGWALARPAWGKGYATEAARAALDYAFTTLPVDKMISLIDTDNIASQKVAEHLAKHASRAICKCRQSGLCLRHLEHHARRMGKIKKSKVKRS